MQCECEVTQSCPTLCDPMNCRPPGSSVQARILEWVAISFSRGSSWPRDWTWVSHIAGRRFTIWATMEADHCVKPTPHGIINFRNTINKIKDNSSSVICLVVSDSTTPWTVAHQAPTSIGFSRQEYWSGQPFNSSGIFPTQGLNQGLPHRRHILHNWAIPQPRFPNHTRQR